MQEVKLETECKIDVVPHGEDDLKDKAEVRYNTLYDWSCLYVVIRENISSIELYAMLTYVASIIYVLNALTLASAHNPGLSNEKKSAQWSSNQYVIEFSLEGHTCTFHQRKDTDLGIAFHTVISTLQ